MEISLVNILTTALTTGTSVDVVVLVFLLGEYVALDRNNRTSSEKMPYYLASIVVISILWLGGFGLLAIIVANLLNLPCLVYVALVLFLIQIWGLILGLSWVGYKCLG